MGSLELRADKCAWLHDRHRLATMEIPSMPQYDSSELIVPPKALEQTGVFSLRMRTGEARGDNHLASLSVHGRSIHG